jgi:pyruvate/2-oxoglutarate/acetoin dehydrogenase E1 component
MTPCAAAAAKLAKDGIKVELIDLRTISPWDTETVLTSVAKTKRAVVVHEAVRNFGAGAEIAATVSEQLFGTLKAPVQRLGAAYCPVPFSKPLETAFMPSQAQIETAVRKALS